VTRARTPKEELPVIRRSARLVTLVAAVATLAGMAGAAAGAGPASAASSVTQPSCAKRQAGHASCFIVVAPPASGKHASTALPSGFGPSDLDSAYNLPTAKGAGETVAIVDAFDDPTVEADLAVYRQTYGLRACTTANGCFTKLNQAGTAGDYPPADGSWALEISLDVDMVSAACPLCHITLVEANSSTLADLAAAENTAAATGAIAVSNSYGGDEFNGMDQVAGDYDHPGTTIVASSGDAGFGTAQTPAVLPTVLAVGGTSLQAASNKRGWTEHAWTGAGSGCSAYIAKPARQTDKHCHMRTVADVSAVADPATGVAAYDTTPFQQGVTWYVVGGTSVSSPLISAVVALSGKAITPSFPYAHQGRLNDVVGGSNATGQESCGGDYLCTAKKGYDAPTGLGTPDGAGAF
jgi:subtilase family serine protease